MRLEFRFYHVYQLDLENVGVAVEIVFLSWVRAEIYVILYLLIYSWLMAATFDLRHN